MHDDTVAPPAGQWPDASLRPADDAPAREWARFYRDHLGLRVFPTPSEADIADIARREVSKFLDDYRLDHQREPPDDVLEVVRDCARASAEKRSKGVWGKIRMDDYPFSASVTDALIDRWWGAKSTVFERGICMAPSQSACGWPLVLVDVDPRHGGDLDGEWAAGLDGPKVRTPGGGVHTLVLATGQERNSGGRTAVGPGVDVIARGTPIKLPSGRSSPGRAWIDWTAPGPAPAALREVRRPAKVVRQRPDGDGDDEAPEREPGDDERPDHGSGYATRMLAEDIPSDVGHRNPAAGAIVGMLARPRACPDDFVNACMMLVVDASAADFERSPDHRQQVEFEAARWRHLLTRGPRDEDFAAEVLAAWIRVRDQTRAPWSEAKARDVARSLWKTCARREADEGEEAGAEDYGVGPRLSVRPPLYPPVPADEVVSGDSPTDHRTDEKDQAVPFPPPSSEVVAAAVSASRVEAPRWRGGVDPASYVRPLGAFYDDEELRRDLERSPIDVSAVFPCLDFNTGEYRMKSPAAGATEIGAPPLYHGWGEHLGRAIGGMSAGDFRVVGAGAAGMGKTWFVSWLVHGLALQTAARLIGVPAYQDRPLILPVWATEMPKRGELYHRAASAHLGFPPNILGDGTLAHEAPGVVAAAAFEGNSPFAYVDKARRLERLHGAVGGPFPLGVARHRVIQVVDLTGLPRRSRRQGVVVDHRVGPDLVEHLADAVDVLRESLARDAGVSADKVLPVVVVDPLQRFAGKAESEKMAIDAVLEAIVSVLCRDLGCAVVATSDTTKAAARESTSLDNFLSKDAAALAADIFAGTQAIMHHADVLALCAERPAVPNALRVKSHARILKSRGSGASDVSFPFWWERTIGRFTAEAPEALRAPPEREHHSGDRHQHRGHDRPTRGPRDFIPPGTDRMLHD